MIFIQEEIDKVVSLSVWNEDTEEYKIPPFNIKAKKINFPNLPFSKAMDLIEVEKQERIVEIPNQKGIMSFKEKEAPRI